MSVSFKLHKKESVDGVLHLYLPRRDFIDTVDDVESVDGVAVVDTCRLLGQRVFVQLICSFRYGSEDDESCGVPFVKTLVMAERQVFPVVSTAENDGIPSSNRLHVKIGEKLGENAFPFRLRFPPQSPVSVTILLPHRELDSKRKSRMCGVEYSVRLFRKNADGSPIPKTVSPSSSSSSEPKKDSHGLTKILPDYLVSRSGTENEVSKMVGNGKEVWMLIRTIQFAPTNSEEQDRIRTPSTVVSKNFLLSPGEIQLEVNLDRQVYGHGDTVNVSVVIHNGSSKQVNRVSAAILQNVDIPIFGERRTRTLIVSAETDSGCPVGPGSTLMRRLKLRPTSGSMVGMSRVTCLAVQGRMRDSDWELASTTLESHAKNGDDEPNVLSMVVSYTVKVRLYLGALNGELSAELPFVLMNRRPKMSSIIKADTLRCSIDEVVGTGDQIEMENLSIGSVEHCI